MMDLHEQLKDIKTQLRLSMNGAVSQSMREKGLVYKLNFGVELPRVKGIAAAYEKDHTLAQALWKEDIRECKILAGLLQPVETFLPEIADIWIDTMPTVEIAELTSMNLFQHLPYASEKVFKWMADEREYFQLCGFLLMTRLLMKGMRLSERAEDEFSDQALTALEEDSLWVRRAAASALCKFALQSRAQAKKTERWLRSLQKSGKPGTRSAVAEIKNEIEYSL